MSLTSHWAVSFILGALVFPRLDAQQVNNKFTVDSSPRVLPYDTQTQNFTPPLVMSIGAGAVKGSLPINVPAGVQAFSVHLNISPATDQTAWKLLFVAGGQVIDVISSDSPRGRSAEAWSGDLSGHVTITLVAGSRPPGLGITVDKYDYPVKPTVPQAIVGTNEMQPFYNQPSDIQQLGSPVARLLIRTGSGQALCTGFLISDELLLTNFHCISTNIDAVNTRVQFGYDKGDKRGKMFVVSGIAVANSDLAYDYVVVRIIGDPGHTYSHVKMPPLGDPVYTMLAAPLGTLAVSDVERNLLVIEHPGGGPKMVSIKDCVVAGDKIAGVDPQVLSDFGHKCDTLGGSSGSPVFSLGAKFLVGLHHLGFVKGSDPTDPLVNQAIYIGYILEDIWKQAPTVYAEIIPNTEAASTP